MTDLPIPLFPIHVGAGGAYWAAKGDTKWSAVRVIKVQRKWAQVERVLPHNQKIIHRKGKVKLDELVKRDPKLKGKDKPTAPPKEVFATVRQDREKAKEQVEITPVAVVTPAPVAPKPQTPKEEAATQARLAKLFDLLGDDSTDDDW